MNINYEFKDKNLLKTALTHISYANDNGVESNQRLEFLGDSILSLSVADYIYERFDKLDEGRLTVIRSTAVCEKSLAVASRKMNLGESILFGKSEAVCGGKDKDSILADTFEAILGAMYLDSDFETCKQWVLDNLKDIIEKASVRDFTNYKSEIQTYFQKRDKNTEFVTYNLIERSGPDHQPSFKVEAVYRGEIIGYGIGKSRKDAEQAAAKYALEKHL